MRYSRNMAWSAPFVESVADLVPAEKITRISGYRVRRGLREDGFGTTFRRRGKFSMNIRIFDLVDGGKYKRSRWGQVLDTLAHELAHSVHWDHTSDHLLLQARILQRFASVVERVGLRDTWARMRNHELRGVEREVAGGSP